MIPRKFKSSNQASRVINACGRSTETFGRFVSELVLFVVVYRRISDFVDTWFGQHRVSGLTTSKRRRACFLVLLMMGSVIAPFSSGFVERSTAKTSTSNTLEKGVDKTIKEDMHINPVQTRSRGKSFLTVKANSSPSLEKATPSDDSITIVEGQRIKFSVTAYDSDDDLTFTWSIRNLSTGGFEQKQKGDNNSFVHTFRGYSGTSNVTRKVKVTIGDGDHVIQHSWTVNISEEHLWIVLLDKAEVYRELETSNQSYASKAQAFKNSSFYKTSIKNLEKYGSLQYSKSARGSYFFFLNAVFVETDAKNATQIANLSFVNKVWDGGVNSRHSPQRNRSYESSSNNTKRDSTISTASTVNAKQYWEDVTSSNWGYEGTGLRKYQEKIAPNDRGDDLSIVVIDTGFDISHPLYNPIWEHDLNHKDYYVNVVGAHYYCGEKSKEYTKPVGCPAGLKKDPDMIDDQDGHGTHDIGVIWQATPNADFYIAELPFASPFIDLSLSGKLKRLINDRFIESIEWAKRKNPDVITTSIGRGGNQSVDAPTKIGRVVNEAADDDTLFIASAGNSGGKKSDQYPTKPSTASEAISVSSTRPNSWKPSVQPKNSHNQKLSPDNSPANPYDNKPDIAAPGQFIGTLSQAREGRRTVKASGSSFAAPHVAGVALLLSRIGTASEVRTAIETSAVDLETDPKKLDGAGRIAIVGAYGQLKEDGAKRHPDPNVELIRKSANGDKIRLKISLSNNAESAATNSNGVHLQLKNAIFERVNLGGFDRCVSSTGVSDCSSGEIGDSVLELYVNGDQATSGIIEVKLTDTDNAKIKYRGWIYDSSSTTINPYAKAQGQYTYEYYTARYPDETTPPDPKKPSTFKITSFSPSKNPPYARAAFDSDFEITNYKTNTRELSPGGTTLSVSPDIWTIGSVTTDSNPEKTFTLENIGSVSTEISISSPPGVSVQNAPNSLNPGESTEFTAELESTDYDGGSITVNYGDNSLLLPIDVTITDVGEHTEQESESLSDEDIDCIFIADVWGDDRTYCDQSGRDWKDNVEIDEDVYPGLVSAKLKVEYRPDGPQKQEHPLEVYVNGGEITDLSSPSDNEEYVTETISLGTGVLKQGDNTIKFTTSEASGYDIGGGTELQYTYKSPPDLIIPDHTDNLEVEPGETFTVQATAKNDGGRPISNVLLEAQSNTNGLTLVSDSSGYTLGTLRAKSQLTKTWTFRLEKNTGGKIEFTALGDASGGDTEASVSMSVKPVNNPPSLITHGVSPGEGTVNKQFTYSSRVEDADGDTVDLTLQIFDPSDQSWQTIGTKQVGGSGSKSWSATPFQSNDEGKSSRFRIKYDDNNGNSGSWGPFQGPTLNDDDDDAQPKTQPTASFDYSPQEPTVGETVTFDATNSSDPDGTIASYEWDFDGDGAVDATGKTVIHTFESTGDYEVSLTVTDSDDQTDTRTKTVSIGPGPGTAFSDDFSSGSFDGYIFPDGDGEHWNIESRIDGNSAHIIGEFDHPESHLIVDPSKNIWSGEGTVKVDFRINPSDFNKNARIVLGPVDNFTTIHFGVQGDGVSIKRPDGRNTNYPMNLPDRDLYQVKIHVDGKKVTVSFLNHPGKDSITHTLDSPIQSGTVGLGLRAWPAFKTGETWFDNLQISSESTSLPQEPEAAFSYSPSEPETGEQVTFNASASTDPDGTITSYEWDFNGDGTTDATGTTVSHTFDTSDNHTVSLVVTDSAGSQDSVSKTISVIEKGTSTEGADFGDLQGNHGNCDTVYTATFRIKKDGVIVNKINGEYPGRFAVCSDYTYSIIDTSNGAVIARKKDKSPDRNKEWSVKFTKDDYNRLPQKGDIIKIKIPGGQKVDHSPGDASGELFELVDTSTPVWSTRSGPQAVFRDVSSVDNDLPIARFSMNTTEITVGNSVKLNASESSDPEGAIVSYRWDFDDDGQTDATGKTVSHTFDAAGNHTVSLTVVDSEGNQDSVTETVSVSESGTSTAVFSDDFSSGSLDNYRIHQGERKYWNIEQRIDGNSLHVVGEANAETHFVVDPAQKIWSGEGTINVDFRVDTSYTNQNAFVVFGPLDDLVRVKFAVQGDEIHFKRSGKDTDRSVNLPNSDLYRIQIEVERQTITVKFLNHPDKGPFTHTLDEPVHSGTVGVGLRSVGSFKVGETWFDNLEVSSGSAPSPEQEPNAHFSYSPSSSKTGEQVTFNASKSTDPDGTIESYEWDFNGDGQTDATGETVRHSFDTAGEYDVTLTVADGSENTNTTTQSVTVSQPGDSGVQTLNVSPIEDGIADRSDAIGNATLYVNATTPAGQPVASTPTIEILGSKIRTSEVTVYDDATAAGEGTGLTDTLADGTFTLDSDGSSVIVIDSTQPKTATLTASTQGKSGSGTVTIHPEISEVKLSVAKTEFSRAEEVRATVSITADDGTVIPVPDVPVTLRKQSGPVEFMTSDVSSLSLTTNETGKATAMIKADGRGTATIEARYGLVTDTVTLAVGPQSRADLQLADQSYTGQTDQLTIANATYTGGSFAIAIHNASAGAGTSPGPIIGWSSLQNAGVTTDTTISLDQSISANTTVTAILHQSVRGSPITRTGTPVSDSAAITIDPLPEPVGTVTVDDQSYSQQTTSVTVANATYTGGSFAVAIHNASAADGTTSGPIIGWSSLLNAGVTTDLTVSLDQPLSANTTVRATLHRSVNGPAIRRDGTRITDTARITVIEEFSSDLSLTVSGATVGHSANTADVSVTVENTGSDIVELPAVTLTDLPAGWSIDQLETDGGSASTDQTQIIYNEIAATSQRNPVWTLSIPADTPAGNYTVTANLALGGDTIRSKTATITVEKPGITVGLSPETMTERPQNTVSTAVTLREFERGVGGYEFNVSVNDTSVATISNIELVGASSEDLGVNVEIASDGSRATVRVPNGDHDTGTIARIILQTGSAGSAELTVSDLLVSDRNFTEYAIAETTSAVLTVSGSSAPPPVIGTQQPTDPDGDGKFEDVTGDGRTNILDVGAFLQNRNSEATQTNVAAFDFTGDGQVNILDVGKLLQQVV